MGDIIINYDSKYVQIHGVRIAFEFFEFLSDKANEGVVFKLINSANEFGSVTVETMREKVM